jgi:hypothetical protein
MKIISCTFDPQTITHPVGEFHCPICHEIQFPGIPHTTNATSDFDVPNSGAKTIEMD